MDIIITGLSKCGKTSIKKVVFEKYSPHELNSVEPAQNIDTFKVENLGYTSLYVRDYPSNYNFDKAPSSEFKYLTSCGVLVYVIDCNETNSDTYDYFREIVFHSFNKNPKINIEIFIHKADGTYFLKNNYKNKHRTEVQNKIKEILNELNIDINIGYYSTSIYNHSLFEAFSKIFQKIMPQNSLLSGLLDNLSTSCRFEKAYLFDVINKIYLAIDASPIEEQYYEICSDMIDVVLDMSGIYGETNMNEINFDENSHSLIKINNARNENSKSLLYLRFIDVNLALTCIINDENYERQHFIDYNIKLFREAVREIFKL